MGWETILLILGAGSVFAECLTPAKWLPPLPNDKLLHFLAFGGLTLLAGRVTHGVQFAASLAVIFAAGWVIEALQRWIPGRRFCWRDLVANTAGILTAAAITQVLVVS